MNIILISTRFFAKIIRTVNILYFIFIKHLLYKLSYNNNGNEYRCKGILTRSTIKIGGRNNRIYIEKGVRLHKVKISISGENNFLMIHENVIFSEGGRIRIDDKNNKVEIGRCSTFVNCYFAVNDNNGKIEIGKDCMFSGDVIIRNSDVHSILNMNNERINLGKDTIIGNRVWCCAGANILKGTTIGDDCVIGTQSVVAGFKVPHNSIIVGNPAKIVRNNIHWSRERL